MSTPSPDFTTALQASTDERDKTLVIRQVTPDIVTFSVPFTRAGFLPIGGRSTAVKVKGDVFLYASHPPTPATKEVLAKLGGEVKWLVTPDGEHGMYISDYVKLYPNAQAIGVARHKEKKPEIKWAGLFGSGGETQTYGFEPEITLHNVAAHVNHEIVAIHHPSGTLIEGDMLFNLPPTEQYSRAGGLPLLSKLTGGGSSMSPGGMAHTGAVSGITKDKELMKKELQPILSAKWDRVIPCHGDVIETGGKVAWDKVWAKYS